MTTLTWIYIIGAVVEAGIVTAAFFGLRSYRTKFRRQHLLPFIAAAVPWFVLAFIFWNPVFSTFLLASVIGIYAPCIYWMLTSPNDNRVA